MPLIPSPSSSISFEHINDSLAAEEKKTISHSLCEMNDSTEDGKNRSALHGFTIRLKIVCTSTAVDYSEPSKTNGTPSNAINYFVIQHEIVSKSLTLVDIAQNKEPVLS